MMDTTLQCYTTVILIYLNTMSVFTVNILFVSHAIS